MDISFFMKPKNDMQKRYEALRALYVDKQSANEVAKKFNYSIHTVYYLKKQSLDKKFQEFFLPLHKGAYEMHNKTVNAEEIIIDLRKKKFSIIEIQEHLLKQKIKLSMQTIRTVLEREGFAKLYRRTKAERLLIINGQRNNAEKSSIKTFGTQQKISTPFGGIFLFMPILSQLNIDKIINEVSLYGSKEIPKLNYFISYLSVKLLGIERLSHIKDYHFDIGLGASAGLNVLPSSTALTEYTYKNTKKDTIKLLKGFVKNLRDAGFIKGHKINLDFHSIPHFGNESELEDNWISTRNKRMKSVLAMFAQDLETTFLCYSNGDIKNSEANDEILQFVKFYKETNGVKPECLVFDSKLTTYSHLDILANKEKIKFITLKKRGKKFIKSIANIKNWTSIKLDSVSREYRNLKINEQKVSLSKYTGNIRQIIVTGNGRELPMVLITNDTKSSAKDIITTYTKRWRIENNIQENVDFFNLNALSSPVIVKVNFDIAITLIANSLYKILAKDIRFFENSKSSKLFRNFIEINSDVEITDDSLIVTFYKKAFTPLLKDWIKDKQSLCIPWLDNKKLVFNFKN